MKLTLFIAVEVDDSLCETLHEIADEIKKDLTVLKHNLLGPDGYGMTRGSYEYHFEETESATINSLLNKRLDAYYASINVRAMCENGIIKDCPSDREKDA